MYLGKTKILSVLIVGIPVLIGMILINGSKFFKKPRTTIDLSRTSVIKEIKNLGSLETASFSIEKIVEAGQQGNPFQDLLYGDRILLIAHGKVIAGIDVYTAKENDVEINGKDLTINFPAPRILSSTLDNTKTRVYDRTQGFLSRGNKDLESEARQAAEKSITQAACEGGILDEARVNAVQRIKQLFKFAGFTSVKVNIPQGSC